MRTFELVLNIADYRELERLVNAKADSWREIVDGPTFYIKDNRIAYYVELAERVKEQGDIYLEFVNNGGYN